MNENLLNIKVELLFIIYNYKYLKNLNTQKTQNSL